MENEMTVFREISDDEFDSFHSISSIFGKEKCYEEHLIFENGKPKEWIRYDYDPTQNKEASEST